MYLLACAMAACPERTALLALLAESDAQERARIAYAQETIDLTPRRRVSDATVGRVTQLRAVHRSPDREARARGGASG